MGPWVKGATLYMDPPSSFIKLYYSKDCITLRYVMHPKQLRFMADYGLMEAYGL